MYSHAFAANHGKSVTDDVALFSFFLNLQHKVPMLSLEALHHLHIFIFVLAIVHVTFSVLTVVFGGAQVSSVLVLLPPCTHTPTFVYDLE